MPSLSPPATVELELTSAPWSVSLVRAAVMGLGTRLDLDTELLEDLQMVVSEACNNVILHAYPGGDGPVAIRVDVAHDGVEVVVRDHGEGIKDSGELTDEGTGLGLAVIRSLTDEAEFRTPGDGGTELRMRFARPVPTVAARAPGEPADAGTSAHLPGDVVASVAPVALMAGVLGRLARALAAHARFSVARFADIHLVVDSVADHAEQRASESQISFALGAQTRRLMLRVGPLRPPRGQTADDEADEVAGRLPALVDEVRVEPAADSEVLYLALSEPGLARAG